MLLGRPFGPGDSTRVECWEHACVHWQESGLDAPSLADRDGDTVPDYVELVGTVVEEVWSKEVVEYGFRAPKLDLTSGNPGPDGRLDVYLSDVGRNRIFGYASTDDPERFERRHLSAYLVLDDDFSPLQFPTGTPAAEMLEVTVAHEFFHAVQFAYDAMEDDWLREGTAVWMEDEVYDEVDDNRIFLRVSPLTRPKVPLDLAVDNPSSRPEGYEYGSFVFWRFLAERFGTPEVIRRVWELADAAPGGRDLSSLEATETMLAERRTSLRAIFAEFGAANAAPWAFYEEGAAYPVPPAERTTTFTAARRAASGNVRLEHLTNAYVVLRPGARLRSGSRLRVTLDLPGRSRGSEASIVTISRAGHVSLRRLALTTAGDKALTIRFDPREVARVVLVLTNGSDRLDGQTFAYRAQLVS
jgi:hypothetical protein